MLLMRISKAVLFSDCGESSESLFSGRIATSICEPAAPTLLCTAEGVPDTTCEHVGGAGVSTDKLAEGAGRCCTFTVDTARGDSVAGCGGISGFASNKAFLARVVGFSTGGRKRFFSSVTGGGDCCLARGGGCWTASSA